MSQLKSRKFAGMNVTVENPAGSVRRGKNRDGSPWATRMLYDYGFIPRGNGADGEGLDVYLGPNERADHAYVVHQNDPWTGNYDEDKVMLGFDRPEAAKRAYLAHYRPGFYRSMTLLPMDTFKGMLTKSDPGNVQWKRKHRRDIDAPAMFCSESAMDASLDRIVRALDAMLHDSHAASFDADFERRHPRGQPDNAGKFARKGQGQGGQREAAEPDKAAVEPAKASAPPKLPFRPPPPPQGIAGARKAGGFSATGKTNTEIGDMAEKLAQKLKIKSLLRKTPEGKIIRQNPLDAEYDDSGWAFEIKALTTQAVEYKAKMKAHEVSEKLAYAKANGYKPAVMLIVMDLENKRLLAYWREGIGNYRLTPEFHFLGEVKF